MARSPGHYRESLRVGELAAAAQVSPKAIHRGEITH